MPLEWFQRHPLRSSPPASRFFRAPAKWAGGLGIALSRPVFGRALAVPSGAVFSFIRNGFGPVRADFNPALIFFIETVVHLIS